MSGLSSQPSRDTVGVLLTALGGPNSLDEVAPFLSEVRGGRPTPPALVAEYRDRYARIGGKSPLLKVSTAQASALEARLNRGGRWYVCRVGMRHWKPYVGDALAELDHDGVSRVVVLPLTPYHSRSTVDRYARAAQEAAARLGSPLDLACVASWNTQSGLVSAFAHRTTEARARLRAAGASDPPLLFTAHSLPRPLIDSGDDYETELRETMELILERLGRPRAQLAYQSAGRSDEPWLGPSLEAALEKLSAVGETSVVVVPFGFISDHLETLYDLDQAARAHAEKLGLLFERATSLNTDPDLIEAMANAVEERLAR